MVDMEKARKAREEYLAWFNQERTPDVALLRRTLDHIKANLASWNQQVWSEINHCGTVMCFAGHAAAMKGSPVPTKAGSWWIDWRTGDSVFDVAGLRALGPYGTVDVSLYARVILGITEDEADELFDGCNTLDRLEDLVQWYERKAARTTPSE